MIIFKKNFQFKKTKKVLIGSEEGLAVERIGSLQ